VRITLNLDDDLLALARELARRRRTTIGQVVTDLVRQGLAAGQGGGFRNGVPLFEPGVGAGTPNIDLVNRLREEGGR
jgi:hypothetical protein